MSSVKGVALIYHGCDAVPTLWGLHFAQGEPATLTALSRGKGGQLAEFMATTRDLIARWSCRRLATIVGVIANGPADGQDFDPRVPARDIQDGYWTAGAKWVVSVCS